MVTTTTTATTINTTATTTSSSRASRWRKFQKKKELYSKERICLQDVRKATDQRHAQTISLL